MTPKTGSEFWSDLAAALALAVLVVVLLYLPLFA